jgi:hypothetical protein
MGKTLAPSLPLVEGKCRFNRLRLGKLLGRTKYLRRNFGNFEGNSLEIEQTCAAGILLRPAQSASNKQTLPKLVTILTGCRFWVLFCQRTQPRRVFGVMGADRALLCRREVK